MRPVRDHHLRGLFHFGWRVVVLLLLPHGVVARKESEVGIVDWRIQMVGPVAYSSPAVDFLSPSRVAAGEENPRKRSVFVVAPQGVLGWIDENSGQLLHRFVGSDGEEPVELQRGSNFAVAVFHERNSQHAVLRAVELSTGRLAWSKEIDNFDHCWDFGLLPAQSSASKDLLVFLHNNTMEGIDLGSFQTSLARPRWSVVLPSGYSFCSKGTHISPDQTIVVAGRMVQNNSTKFVEINVDTGKIFDTSQSGFSFEEFPSFPLRQHSAPISYIYINPHSAIQLHKTNLLLSDARKKTISKFDLSAFFPAQPDISANSSRLIGSKEKNICVLQGASRTVVLRWDEALATFNLRILEGQWIVGPVEHSEVADSHEELPEFVAARTLHDRTEIFFLFSHREPIVTKLPDLLRGSVVHLTASWTPLPSSTTSTASNFRMFLSFADQSFVALQGEGDWKFSPLWIREESLANAVEVLPFSHDSDTSLRDRSATRHQSRFQRYAAKINFLISSGKVFEIIREEFSDFFVSLSGSGPSIPRVVDPIMKAPDSKMKVRSNVDPHWTLIVSTSSNKIFGIDPQTGEVRWSASLSSRHVTFHEQCQRELSLPSQRQSLSDSNPLIRLVDYFDSHNEKVRSVLAAVSLVDSQPKLTLLDPYMGTIVEQKALSYFPGGDSSLLYLADPWNVSPLLTLLTIRENATATAHVSFFGSSPSPQDLTFLNELSHLHWSRDTDDLTVTSFTAREDVANCVQQANETIIPLHVRDQWNVAFGASGERIILVASSLYPEAQRSPVHVFSDASVLFKVNGPLVSVLSQSKDPQGPYPLTSVHILSGLTGHILRSFVLPLEVSGPYHMITFDNYVLVSYFNPAATRHELFVVELFEPKVDEGPWKLIAKYYASTFGKWSMGLFNEDARASVEGLEAPATPFAYQKTFILPSRITALGVTHTAKGITPPELILAQGSAQLLALPSKVFTARRPLPNQPRQQDDSVPYAPLLPKLPSAIPSHTEQIFSVRKIVSFATRRESTSSVLSLGLDLYFFLSQPAKGYDVLTASFSRLLLIVVLFAVFIATVFTHLAARRALLNKKWK